MLCLISMKRMLLFLWLFMMLMACMPTPQKVSEAIARDQLSDAVDMIQKLLNEDGEITSRKLEHLLQGLERRQVFTLDVADDLFDGLNQDAQKAILRWYINVYLNAAEEAMKAQHFEEARLIWRRHQKVRSLSLPDFEEAVPVQGIIDLREAEYLAKRGQTQLAREKFEQARKKLTQKKSFDRVQQYAFRKLIDEVRQALK